MSFIKIYVSSLLLLVMCGAFGNRGPRNELPKNCGTTRYNGSTEKMRIVGGEQAMLGMVPWMVRLGRTMENSEEIEFFCGGALINRYFVVTAAHCRESYCDMVRAGENYVKTEKDCDKRGSCAPRHQDVRIRRISEPNYCVNTMEHDIALVELRKPVVFNDFVRPVCLPNNRFTRNDLQDTPLLISGWGLTKSLPRQVPDVLMYMLAPLLNSSECNALYTYILVDTQLCIGFPKGKDSCNGDSGGPVTKFIDDDGVARGYLVGVVSYGLRRCGDGPAVYTDVNSYTKWIIDEMAFNSY